MFHIWTFSKWFFFVSWYKITVIHRQVGFESKLQKQNLYESMYLPFNHFRYRVVLFSCLIIIFYDSASHFIKKRKLITCCWYDPWVYVKVILKKTIQLFQRWQQNKKDICALITLYIQVQYNYQVACPEKIPYSGLF